eukprot:gene36870-48092_t
MLDNVIYSGYPIIAADTGSFPERLSHWPNAYIGNGCMGAEKWAEFIVQVHRDRNLNYNRTSTTTPSITTKPTTRYDFDSFSQFLQAVYLFLGLNRPHRTEDWKSFFANVRKRKFVANKKTFTKFIRKMKRETFLWDKRE